MHAAVTLLERVNSNPEQPKPVVRQHRQFTSTKLDLALIEDLADFDKLQPEWNALHASNTKNQIGFQSHAWLRSWIEAFLADPSDTSESLAIVTARTNGKLCVICPLIIRRSLGMTHMMWLGEPASQYGDVITDGTASSSSLVVAALDFAVEQYQPDLVHLRKVRGDAAVIAWLDKKNAVSTSHDAAPFLDFRDAESFDAYCSKFSAKSRKNRRRLRRRLEEMGKVTTSILPIGDAACDAIHIAIAYKQKWLVDRGQISSALRDENMTRFLVDVVNRPDPTAMPFVSTMYCDETPVSVQFGVISNQRLALHMIAYNPETEKTGAGVLHIEDTIAHCIDSGLKELDFLAPNAAYKQDWADASTPVNDYVTASSIKGRVYAQGYLCSAREVLKKNASALPLGMRQNIAKHMQK